MQILYTSAPEAYDWFGTKTILNSFAKYKGEDVRKVEVDPNHVESQLGRYLSGMHLTIKEKDLEEYRFLLDFE